ncbi:hypothetical protein J4526_02700 [Desulfurococcaceae archaeon MEX13E-LK6-19]|nr:hypothetical protein J4526_02700 [Desulfurococcaceae archaeon MEX13E-LK6-19]
MKRSKPLVLGIPSSILETEPSLREKTLKTSLVLRAAAIFRVDEIIIYNDGTISEESHTRYSRLIKKIHRYLTTPPYLRKKLVPLDNDLKYIGIAPPLRLHVFDVGKHPSNGEYRIGVVVESKRKYMLVDAGLKNHVKTFCEQECPSVNELVVINIVSINPLKAIYDKKFEETIYLGPSIRDSNIINSIKDYRAKGYYLIATSRKGRIVDIKTLRVLSKKLTSYKGVYVLFGGPYAGLYEIFSSMGFDLDELVDLVVNTIPCQGTKTVRTEEAIYASLALLNIVLKE